MFTNEKLNIKQINVVTTNMSQNFEIWFSKKCESSWKNLRYLVANEPLLWIKALSWWSEDMDWQHNWSALSLSWLAFFFGLKFQNFDLCLWSHYLLIIFVFMKIYFVNLESYFVLHSMYFTMIFLIYVLCFQHVFSTGMILSATECHT